MIPKITELINNHKSFLITSHVKLDGDAIGSELALYHLLCRMGKSVVVYNQDEVPGNYRFLPGSEVIVHELPPLDKIDVVFVVDCGELDRVGEQSEAISAAGIIVNIDHHVSNRGKWSAALVDHHASSTAEMLFRLIRSMNVEITVQMATNLYAAILTDTGGFRYGNTSKETLFAAGTLLENGADPQWISENIYESNPPGKVRLMSKVLGRLNYDLNGRMGSLVVFIDDFSAVGALPEHTENFVDIPRSTQGVVVSVLFTEIPDGYFKVSMRSKGNFNVERIASSFGGGGHINAAACRIKGNIEEVRVLVTDAVKAGLDS